MKTSVNTSYQDIRFTATTNENEWVVRVENWLGENNQYSGLTISQAVDYSLSWLERIMPGFFAFERDDHEILSQVKRELEQAARDQGYALYHAEKDFAAITYRNAGWNRPGRLSDAEIRRVMGK